jgi:hypothetical protein
MTHIGCARGRARRDGDVAVSGRSALQPRVGVLLARPTAGARAPRSDPGRRRSAGTPPPHIPPSLWSPHSMPPSEPGRGGGCRCRACLPGATLPYLSVRSAQSRNTPGPPAHRRAGVR